MRKPHPYTYRRLISEYRNCVCVCPAIKSCLTHVTTWTVALHAPLSMEYWSELPFPPPGDLPKLNKEHFKWGWESYQARLQGGGDACDEC